MESEDISKLLHESGLKCQVLNAKNDELEAKIIARAGTLNAITISTNMAGRGTDIRLGGPDGKESEAVKKAGGLYVLGTNRHESLRIDLQLRGRAGRQGDPGSTRFFICPQDDLFERYHLGSMFPDSFRSGYQNDTSTNRISRRNILKAQRIVEAQNSEIRKTLFHYAQIVEKQRKAMAQWRQGQLKGIQSSGFLSEKASRYYERLSQQLGKTMFKQIERQIILYHIDSHWSEHLATVADIREGIHLFRLSGQIPLEEYQKQVQSAFIQMNDDIEQAIIKTFKSLISKDTGVEFRIKDLAGPSSTWTYMLNDNPFSNLGTALIASRNIGFAVGAARSMILYAPLFLLMMLIKKIRKRTNSNPA
jgi:preprotein translocase subunit SecA